MLEGKVQRFAFQWLLMRTTFVSFLDLKSQDLNTAERVSPNRFSYRGVHKI